MKGTTQVLSRIVRKFFFSPYSEERSGEKRRGESIVVVAESRGVNWR
jgi:hypothetical protein